MATKKDFEQVKSEILSRIDVQREYELLGVKFSGRPSASGWLTCSNPWRKDVNPSCGVNISSGTYRGYLCAFNENGRRGKPYASFSFWDVAADFLPGSCGDFGFVLNHYADKMGVKFKNERRPPTKDMIVQFMRDLPEEAREHLKSKRGLSDESIEKYEIGFRKFDSRNTFPVYDSDGDLANIRYHNSKLKPKTLNHPGFGQARLWGADRLAKAPAASIVTITEGEFDSILIEQETGLISVSPTNGKSAFSYSWVPYFHGHHVILVWDCDRAGRDAVEKVVIPAFQDAVISNKVLSLKIVWLYGGDAPKDEKDFTDFIVRSGGTGAQLLEKIKKATPYKYSKAQIEDPPVDPDLFFDGNSFTVSEMRDFIKERYNLIHDGACFLQYEDGVGFWKECDDSVVAKIISNTLGRRMKKCYVSDALKTIEWEVFKSPQDLKLNPFLINMANGMLDIENGNFLPHDKKFLSRIQIPIPYDENAKCPRWMQFLEEIFPNDPDKALALQDFSGYCFLHEIPFEKCLFLVGTGANGKSVFIRTLTKIIGLENTCSLDPQVFGEDKFLLGSLKDKLLNTCSELNANKQIAANVFKKVVSGDLIQADMKYQRAPFKFFPIAKHIFSMNETPIITDRSFAFERRLVVVNFNQTFKDNNVDYQLEKKLEKELPGIFNWAMEGLERVMTDYSGITETPTMKTDRKIFIQKVNPVLMFVDERCNLDENQSVWKTELYTRYAEWCKESGLKQLSKIRFYNQLSSDFPAITEGQPKNNGNREFRGIGMKVA
jgi:putative DNA primase/helicase